EPLPGNTGGDFGLREPVHETTTDSRTGEDEGVSRQASHGRRHLRHRERNSLVKNRMRETCTSGSVRGGDGNIPTYSAQFARFEVHRGELPPFDRVVHALVEAALLFLVADRKPVFQQDDSRSQLIATAFPRRSGKRRGIPCTPPWCKIPSRARRPRGCTSCGRIAPFHLWRAAARHSAENTIAHVRARWASPGR